MAISTYKVWIDRNENLINPDSITEVNGIQYARGTVLGHEEAVAYLGLRQIDVTDPRPDDFSDELYFRTEPTSAPLTVSYISKSEDSKKETHNQKIWAKIKALESESLFPRQLREFMLDYPGASGKGWYAKIKDIDDKVADLKSKLKNGQGT